MLFFLRSADACFSMRSDNRRPSEIQHPRHAPAPEKRKEIRSSQALVCLNCLETTRVTPHHEAKCSFQPSGLQAAPTTLRRSVATGNAGYSLESTAFIDVD